ncbi:MAG: hypothetical protein IJ481_02260 [Alphaproteobacteria bacterium]|nr:hypothetical protein [Alphaproteobacteria bacterium]
METDFKTSNFTVAKICHEMANHLSVLKFIQEDLQSENPALSNEIRRSLDLLINTLDFFRSLFVESPEPIRVYDILLKIARLRDIGIKVESNYDDFEDIHAIISALIYIIIKTCKRGDIVNITEDYPHVINISVSNQRLVSDVTITSLNENVQPNSQNILLVYIKEMLSKKGYNIIAQNNIKDGVNISICKK